MSYLFIIWNGITKLFGIYSENFIQLFYDINYTMQNKFSNCFFVLFLYVSDPLYQTLFVTLLYQDTSENQPRRVSR